MVENTVSAVFDVFYQNIPSSPNDFFPLRNTRILMNLLHYPVQQTHIKHSEFVIALWSNFSWKTVLNRADGINLFLFDLLLRYHVLNGRNVPQWTFDLLIFVQVQKRYQRISRSVFVRFSHFSQKSLEIECVNVIWGGESASCKNFVDFADGFVLGESRARGCLHDS